MNMNTKAQTGRFPLGFFVLAFILSLPIWIFSGKRKLPLPFDLPMAALVTFVPATAASIVAYRQSGVKGVKALWKRALDYRKIKNKIWYLPMLGLPPLIYVVSYGVMRLTGLPLPERVEIPLFQVPVLLVMFFIGDTGEELGWTGYATDPLQNRWGALKGSLILGGVWALWHAIPLVQTGNPASWVLWQTLGTIPLRILHVWIYNNTGKSVFATTLFHVTGNISWTLFPNSGSHYNPFVTTTITLITAGVVVLLWDGKTLTRFRFAKPTGEAADAGTQSVISYNQREG